MQLHDTTFDRVPARVLYDILQLRVDIFVVEQECAYAELDGRDTEPDCRHIWMADGDTVAGYVRVLTDGDTTRIGRVVTRDRYRGQGLAARLVDHVVASSAGPFVLDAQSHLQAWYERFGFTVTGPEYVEDGIPHVPMARPADG